MSNVFYYVLGEGMWDKVKQQIRRSTPVCSLIGVTDGEVYRNIWGKGNVLHNNNNLTVIFNSDGVALCKSSRIGN